MTTRQEVIDGLQMIIREGLRSLLDKQADLAGPGIGNYAVTSLLTKDAAPIQGFVLFVAVVYALIPMLTKLEIKKIKNISDFVLSQFMFSFLSFCFRHKKVWYAFGITPLTRVFHRIWSIVSLRTKKALCGLVPGED